ncbi:MULTISPECIES: nodulation protein NopC [Allomesorhizobium]|uniref:Nodulation protein NopC n=1 Tax=Allomesorhizobium camelthorni TaxID=475069 RepID=A0A6G4WHG9_9HYPH|nr:MULTISPECIES: nodulation protein NopC [Mesorhizobium]NGO54242.1 nodulation protein NopC [Mesorhizobium camelthorni]
MVAAIGSGVGGVGVSLARSGGHGHSSGQPSHASGRPSDHNKPADQSKPADQRRPADQNGPVSRRDRADIPTNSGDGSQVVSEEEYFQLVLTAVACTIMSEVMAETEDAMAETEEDA